jgi:archaemetzincin
LAKARRALAPLARRQPQPRPGDWRFHHKQREQSFARWRRSDPVLPTDKRRIIYIQPIGEFSADQRKILAQTGAFVEAFFSLPVKVREGIDLSVVPAKVRRLSRWGHEQILAPYILEKVLAPSLPDDAACVLALTASDLWPGEGWNFVFGQASLKGRVGVWSMHRFGRPDRNEQAYRKVLLRTIKTGLHETGHMFSMEHCTAWRCGMAGANSLEEADQWPMAFCPQCVSKVCAVGGVDPLERYKKLRALCEKAGLEPEMRFYRRCIEALDEK